MRMNGVMEEYGKEVDFAGMTLVPDPDPGEDRFYPIEVHQVEDDQGKYFLAFYPDIGFSACSATGETIEEAISSLMVIKQSVGEFCKDKGATFSESYSKTKRPWS